MAPPSLWDPVGYGEPLPLAERFYPAGFPLTLETNSAAVVRAAAESWGEYEPTFEAPPVEVRVVVRGDPAEPPLSVPDGPAFRAQGHLLAMVLGPQNFAVCDLERSVCFAWLSEAVARNPLFAGFHFLEGMALNCLCHRDLTPIHAACVASGGKGILLAGEAQAGKSSLAWACARAGLTYVADDGVYLLRRCSDPFLIGKPQRIRFRPEVVELLPELVHLPRLETVIGKRSFEIRTAGVPGIRTAFRCRPARVLFLDRRSAGPAEVTPVAPEEAILRLSRTRALWEPRVWDEQEASLQRLAGLDAGILRYSLLDDAVDCILKLA